MKAWLALVVLAAGCGAAGQLGYLVRAGWSEARILWRREPIARVLARPGVDATLRERLELTLAVRAFAAHPLGLRVGGSYLSYAPVDGEATVWVLGAARRDRLVAHTWWYPLVGRVPYRGFFSRAAAETAGRGLAARDLDVDVRPAAAFSTLGWFADPLLSTVAAEPPVAIAETVLHELWHATLYVPGAAEFNESAAIFVGHRGAVAFFCSGPGASAEGCAEARRRWAATRARGRVLGRLARRLRRLFAGHPPPAARERERAALARAAAASLARRGLPGGGALLPPNNARLLGDLVYLTRLDDFERLAPGDAPLGAALAGLVARAGREADPFAALATLASRSEGRYSARR